MNFISLNKQIYIYNDGEFGNKVFTLIYGIYLYNLYKGECKINYVIDTTKDNKIYEQYLDIIFPDTKTKINFIKYEELLQDQKIIINKILKTNYKTYKSLTEFPKYEDLDIDTYFKNCYDLTYKMYNTFSKSDIDIFQNINKKLITDENILLYQNLDYAIIDIRYNINIINNVENNVENIEYDTYLLYTPQYYKDMIRKINPNLFIIIITDSQEIVNDYIVNNYYVKNNYIFINSNNLNSFFLYYNAKHIIMSNNTFSMAGSYFNNNNANIYYLLYTDESRFFSLPEEKAISDKWHIISDKKYILNYNVLLLTELHNFIRIIDNKIYKKNIFKLTTYYNFNNNNDNNIVNFNYNNKTDFSYNEFLYYYKMLMLKIYNKFIKNPYSINKFYEELYFDKILNDNNINSCIFITKNVWSLNYKRLFDYSDVSIYKLYANEHDHNGYDLHKPLSYYINKEIQKYESLILFLIKDDYGIEFDFIYDYYMFKINEYLNTVKNLKLLIIAYEPNLILPFTLNTLINICNHSESYNIKYINNYVYVIFNNIKNFNIDVTHLRSNFKHLYDTIIYINNEEILKEIAISQNNKTSIGSSYIYKFNNFTDNKNNKNNINDTNNTNNNNKYEYKINLIKYPINVHNETFVIDLLLNIYKSYDYINYRINLYLPKNINNKLLYEEFFYNKANNWHKLIYNENITKK